MSTPGTRDGDVERTHEAVCAMMRALGEDDPSMYPDIDEVAGRIGKRTDIAGILREAHLVQVDDDRGVLEAHLLEIAVATAGNCRFLLVRPDQSAAQVAELVNDEGETTVTLMDGTMYGITGPEVVAQASSVRHIGYSSNDENKTRQAFLQAGAIGFLHKERSMEKVRQSLLRVRELLGM